MKRSLYFLSFILILNIVPQKSHSQYLSLFGSTSTEWDIIVHGYCDAVCSSSIFVTGDTAIGLNTYKIISGLPGFVREHSIQGKAWFYDTTNSSEYLVMDLGLSVGDTFYIYNFSSIAVPFFVDSIYYQSNLKHVRLNAWITMCALNEKINFVEGSGPNASFSYQRDLNGNGVSSYMLCHLKNGIGVAGNILFSNACTVCDVGINKNEFSANSIKISPNPLTYSSILELNAQFKDAEVFIYNILGKEMMRKKLTDNRMEIERGSLESGVYVVRVTCPDNFGREGERQWVEKVVVE